MQCPTCGREWPEEFEFCPKCGIAIVSIEADEGSAVATGSAAATVGDRNVVIPGRVGGDVKVTYGPQGPDPAALHRAYLYRLQKECGRLPLRGVDLEASDPARAGQPLNLANVYIDLDTTVRVPADAGPGNVISTALEHSLALDREGKRPVPEGRGNEELRPVSALECTARFQRLVLLGDPGGGKTTFLNHLSVILARAQMSDGLTPFQTRHPAWHDDAWNLLPLPVTLRDLARKVATESQRGTAGLLWEHIEGWLAACDLGDYAPHLKKALREGRVQVLLDGLDEVPTAEQRAIVRDAVADFAATYCDARLLVTCRTLSYQDTRWKLPHDFAVFELTPFDEAKIDAFVEAWYGELESAGTVRPGEGAPLAHRLRAAVRRPDLWRLAPNPLLLTVMALVHTHKGRLPEARALLYEECVEMLLWRWELLKSRAGSEEASGLRRLLQDVGLQTVDLKRTLWQLAYQVHAEDRSGDETLADLQEGDLLRALRRLHPEESWDWAQAVVDQIRERAGLLVERQPGVYAFPHRTFQEYLAACHLSIDRQFGRQGARLAREDARWREVILLAVGRLVHHQGETDRPLALVAELCPAAAPDTDETWRAAWLAGEVLVEAGLPRIRQSALGQEQVDRVQGRLVALVERGALAPRERAEAGDVLGTLGDPRFDAEAFWLPGRFRGEAEPLLGFLPVLAGAFQMGGEQFGDEQPIHRVEVGEFYVARYPVTNAQYAAFVRATDRESPQHWNGPQPPAALRHHPVIYVSWHEARAYCDWLTERLREWEELPEPLAGLLRVGADGGPPWLVRLPTEAEWEKAAGWDAGSGQKREWPWGDEWDMARCNTWEIGIGATMVVGLFPSGASPYNTLDMTGNVREWTNSQYQTYPFRMDDGREDPDGDQSRVLRGGGFIDIHSNARCASRYGNRPDGSWYGYGFRVVIAPALPSGF